MNSVAPGTHVTASIRLVRPLGAGAMGSVWLADHLSLETQVVVKFMSEVLANDATSVARFKREAAAAASVKSPHVVQIFDFGIASNGAPYIVMELLEGEDLRRFLERRGVLAPHEVASIVAQVARGLGRAHERGVIHRDVKPDNIFLCDAGQGEVFVKIVDFGIAKTTSPSGFDATKTGALLGTPYYMSPEQVLGAKNIDGRTDLWSLGIVAYEALTGARAFHAETLAGLAMAIVHDPMPSPSATTQHLSPAIDAWFARACARDLNARFSTAKELADALQAAAHGQVPQPSLVPPTPSVPAMPATMSATTPSSAPKTNKLPWLLGAAALALAMVASVVVLATRTPPAEPASEHGATSSEASTHAPAASPVIEEPAPKPSASASASASSQTSAAPPSVGPGPKPKPANAPPKVLNDPNIF